MVELRNNKASRRLEFFEKQYDGAFGNYLCMNQIALIRLHHRQALYLLRSVTPKDASIIDIGCACGDFSSQVASNFSGAKVTGIDFVAKGFCVARKRYPHLQFVQGALPHLPFANSSVNIVLCMEMLYYLEEQSRSAAVQDMSRILSPEGFLLVGTTLGNPRYFTERTLMEATTQYFEIVDCRFEYLKPYIGAIKILRRNKRSFSQKRFRPVGSYASAQKLEVA